MQLDIFFCCALDSGILGIKLDATAVLCPGNIALLPPSWPYAMTSVCSAIVAHTLCSSDHQLCSIIAADIPLPPGMQRIADEAEELQQDLQQSSVQKKQRWLDLGLQQLH